jgi:hypothetical protein
MSDVSENKAGVARADVWLALGLAVLAGLAFYPFAAVRFDAHHDGIMLKPALDVLSGQVLFRDTFTQYGPLTTYLQALALAIEPTLLSIRLLSVVAQAGALGFFYLAWRAVLPRPVALVAGVVFIAYPMFYFPHFAMPPWSSTLALFFQSAALLALVRLVGGGRSSIWGWVLGVACACTFWCRQPVGGFLMISVAACAVGLWQTGWRHPRDDWRRMGGRVLLGGAGVSALILGHLALNGALGDWWEQNVLWPRRWAGATGETIFGVFARNLFLQKSVVVVPLVVLLAFLPSLVRRLRPGLSRRAELVWWPVLCVVYWLGAERWVRPMMIQLQGGWSVLLMITTAGLALWVIGRAVAIRWRAEPVSGDYHVAAMVAAVALASIPQVYPMASGNHMFWAMAPSVGVFCHVVYRVSGLGARECALGLLLIFSLVIYERYRWGLFTATQPFVRLESPAVMRGIRAEPVLAEAVARVDEVISRVLAVEPEVEVILYGDDALYLTWFKNRENPTPFYVSWTTLLTEEQRALRWDFLVSRRPVVLLNGASASDLKFLPGDYRVVLQEPLMDLRVALPRWLREKMAEVGEVAE